MDPPQRCVTENVPEKAQQQVNIYLQPDESKWKYSHHCQSATAHNKQEIKYV